MPLPKPNANEDRNGFVSRCIIDANMRNEYGSLDQRIAICNSLYDQEHENKAQKNNWINDYEKALSRAESQSKKNFTNYYFGEYNKAIKLYEDGSLNAISIGTLFKYNDIVAMYKSMYVDVGIKMFKWFKKNYDAEAKKQERLDTLYAEQFAQEGLKQAGTSVTLVSGTAKASLEKVIKKLSADAVFQSSGAVVQARMFRKEFKHYSKYQAERLVRTESNYLANYANEQAALSAYPNNQLKKRWIAVHDGRTRDSHDSMDLARQVKMMNEPFNVNGKLMMRPGDKSGGAKEVINCRCVLAYEPVPNAQTIADVTDIGFGLSRELVTQSQFGIVESIVNNAIREELIRQVDYDQIAKEMKGFNSMIKDIDDFPKEILEFIDNPKQISFVNNTNKYDVAFHKVYYRNYNSENEFIEELISINKKIFLREGVEVLKNTIVHEIAHAIHTQKKWIVEKSIINNNMNPIVKNLFDKYADKRLDFITHERLKELYRYDTDIYKKLGISRALFRDELGAYSDTIMALTNGKIGEGHRQDYWGRSKGVNRYKEFFVHAFENKFVGNKTFQYLDPELYNEMIEMVNQYKKLL